MHISLRAAQTDNLVLTSDCISMLDAIVQGSNAVGQTTYLNISGKATNNLADATAQRSAASHRQAGYAAELTGYHTSASKPGQSMRARHAKGRLCEEPVNVRLL
eukprot:6203349-Pleurochrysis_carterae.AAC.2